MRHLGYTEKFVISEEFDKNVGIDIYLEHGKSVSVLTKSEDVIKLADSIMLQFGEYSGREFDIVVGSMVCPTCKHNVDVVVHCVRDMYIIDLFNCTANCSTCRNVISECKTTEHKYAGISFYLRKNCIENLENGGCCFSDVREKLLKFKEFAQTM
jgi:hypothetical protein